MSRKCPKRYHFFLNCCESFLDWCNRELTPNSWVVIYEGFKHSDAKVHKNEASAKDSISAWENGIIEDMGFDTYNAAKLSAEARCFIAPVFIRCVRFVTDKIWRIK